MSEMTEVNFRQDIIDKLDFGPRENSAQIGGAVQDGVVMLWQYRIDFANPVLNDCFWRKADIPRRSLAASSKAVSYPTSPVLQTGTVG